ncbi:MAG: diguanylate cyclase [Actinomycetota bacterium]
MSLQRRLTLFFTLVVILPLAAAGFIVQRVTVEEIKNRSMLSLRPALGVARVVYRDRIDGMKQQVRASVDSTRLTRLLERERRRSVERFFIAKLQHQGLDFLIATAPDGRVLGKALEPPEYVEGVKTPTSEDILDADPPVDGGLARSDPLPVVGRGGKAIATVVGGFWIDDDILVGDTEGRVELAVVVDGNVVASTELLEGPVPVAVDARSRFDVSIAGQGTAEAEIMGPGTALVAWAPNSPIRALEARVLGSLVVLLLLVLVAIAVLAHLMASVITRPLAELSAGAKAIAEGRYGHTISVRAEGEIGEVASAFNDMSARLKETVDELSSSRAQFQRAVQRFAKTLRSTHNMDQMLESLLETAADAVGADGSVLWRFSATRRELYPHVVRGIDEPLANVPVGSGIVGLVAERGTPLIYDAEKEDPRAPAPDFPNAIAAPLHSQNRIQGVMLLSRRDRARSFARTDLNTVVFLAEQGGVAIENVVLHEEAQRLSLTDGLTGVWNRRYFQMQFRQVLATAVRFERPFSVLMMDLDTFKAVNDTFGHQRGDATLVEFTRRVNGVLREVDTFARYGGEEFIALLSETDFSGARTTADKILDVVKTEPFGEPGEPPIRVTVSIGVASHPRHGTSFSKLVEAADQALYKAKQEGRDRVVVAGESPPNLTVAR